METEMGKESSSYWRLYFLLLILPMLIGCNNKGDNKAPDTHLDAKEYISKMILVREKAMKQKDLAVAMGQFDESATWINSQGYYFEGKNHVEEFHKMLLGNDSLDYYYEAGEPKIRILDPDHAIAYYSWKMFWFRKANPSDTTNFEIGLMTLHAQKKKNLWKWVAVTNQHTPWFYKKVLPVPSE